MFIFNCFLTRECFYILICLVLVTVLFSLVFIKLSCFMHDGFSASNKIDALIYFIWQLGCYLQVCLESFHELKYTLDKMPRVANCHGSQLSMN